MIIMDISRGMCKTIKECLSKGSKGGISESRVWEWGVREEEQGGRIKGQQCVSRYWSTYFQYACLPEQCGLLLAWMCICKCMDVYFTRKFQTVLSGKHPEDSKSLPRSLGLDRCIRWAEGLCWTCECGCPWDKRLSAVCTASTELEQPANSWGRCLGHPQV